MLVLALLKMAPPADPRSRDPLRRRSPGERILIPLGVGFLLNQFFDDGS